MTEEIYYTIKEPSTTEFRDRGSRFIAYAYPVSDVSEFKERMADIRKEHPKATHYCFAYRIGLDGNNFRVSDDGEPSGSAGRPILGQIDSKQLTNVLVVVVRYFGGTQLGIPGLINAYKTVTALVLQITPITQKPVLVNYILTFDYTQVNDVMKIVRQFDCLVHHQDMQLFCSMGIGIPKNRINEVLFRINDLRGVDAKTY